VKKILALASFAVLALASSFAQTNTIQLRNGSNSTTILPSASTTIAVQIPALSAGTHYLLTSTSNPGSGGASINGLSDGKLEGESSNNFLGSMKLGSRTTGVLSSAWYNTAVGMLSMNALTGGSANVSLGYNSLNALTLGNENTAIGANALSALVGANYNTAVGTYAGVAITSGAENVLIGRATGYALTTGSGNVLIGYNVGFSIASDASNLLDIDNSTTNTPLIYGNFSTDQLTLNGHVEVAIGTTTSTVPFSILGTGIQGAANVENAYLGTDVPTLIVRNSTNSADADALLVAGVGGSSAGDAYISLDVRFVGGWSIGIDNSDYDKLKFVDSWNFKSDGGTPAYGLPVMTMTRLTRRVGIGTENPAYMLDVAGDIQANTTVYTSDARLKRNVQPIGNALGTVAKLRPVSYEKRADLRSNDYSMKQMGFIAQELESVLPNSVHTDKSADAIKSVDYISIIPVLTKALQEQQQMINKQQAEIDELRQLIKRMSVR
jgi:hypothetical protein